MKYLFYTMCIFSITLILTHSDFTWQERLSNLFLLLLLTGVFIDLSEEDNEN